MTTSIATRSPVSLYDVLCATADGTVGETVTRTLKRLTGQSLDARLDRDIARLRREDEALREILAEDDPDYMPYHLVRAEAFAAGTWVEDRQGTRGKVVSRRGQQGIVSVADIDRIWGVGDPPMGVDAWADARPIESDGSPWLGADQAQPLTCLDCGRPTTEAEEEADPWRCADCVRALARLQPVRHVLRGHWATASASERHWVCVAALHAAELARSRPERVQRVRYDLARMQWTVEVDAGDDGPPIVIRIGDEDVRAWAEAHGFSRPSAEEVLLPT